MGARNALRVLLLTLACCSDSASDHPAGDEPLRANLSGSQSPGVQAVYGVSEVLVDGVSIFEGPPNGEQALHGGLVEINGDCLTVGDVVVIWPVGRLAEIEQIVRSLSTETKSITVLTGGGYSERVPNVVRERCAVEEVFYAGLE